MAWRRRSPGPGVVKRRAIADIHGEDSGCGQHGAGSRGAGAGAMSGVIYPMFVRFDSMLKKRKTFSMWSAPRRIQNS